MYQVPFPLGKMLNHRNPLTRLSYVRVTTHVTQCGNIRTTTLSSILSYERGQLNNFMQIFGLLSYFNFI